MLSTETSAQRTLPNFSVFVLGMRGAGKTVLLSSMYRSLMTYSERCGYFLRCTNDRLSAELIENFGEIERTDGWPQASQGEREYVFDCAYVPKFRDAPNTLCSFSFVDFPGGYVTGEGAATFSVRERAEASDSILVLLDGKKIKDHIDGIPDAGRSILDEVLLMTPAIQACAAVRKPIHFLITKADLLPLPTYKLRRIQNELFKIRPFLELLQYQSRSAPIRMVPVSAVGDKFAYLDPATRKMKKQPGAFARPYNVDSSIALTLSDHLRVYAREGVTGADRSILESTARFIAAIVKAFDGDVLGGAIEVIEQFTSFRGASSGKKMDVKIKKILEDVDDQKSAFGAVLTIQALLMQRFEKRLPESNLNKRIPRL